MFWLRNKKKNIFKYTLDTWGHRLKFQKYVFLPLVIVLPLIAIRADPGEINTTFDQGLLCLPMSAAIINVYAPDIADSSSTNNRYVRSICSTL